MKRGRGWHKDADPTGEGHAKAGRAGGRKTFEERGSTFYSQISRGRKKQEEGAKKNEDIEATIPVDMDDSDLEDLI